MMSEDSDPSVERIGELLTAAGRRLAVAESLTGGELSARLACVEGAGG
jgi:nicotinamide mononucleotide (NMN) deamidase PncC